MRLWSIHPKYLDAKGLVALWREGLLAQAVLRGKTIGYTHHPQLIRFKNHPQPTLAINTYLFYVLEESKNRGYRFDGTKVDRHHQTDIQIDVTKGQIAYEHAFLCQKLNRRDPILWDKIKGEIEILTHPLFKAVEGVVEQWEKVK